MCGIAGLYEPHGRVDLGRLHRMSELLRHRGPDDEGMALIDPDGGAVTLGGPDTPAETYASRLPYAPGRSTLARVNAPTPLGLLHRRLSIVDLSPAGHQPMCDTAGRRWITYNGEVYNYVELRRELEALGEPFVSSSDTEVILAAYRRFGQACLDRFNGMFAFALWDGARQELFCARDRLGVKPFYYQWDGRRFAFASEPRALVLTQSRRIRPRLDAVRDLIALDWVDHDAGTFFDGVWQLPAGHSLTAGPGGLSVRRWWGLDPARHARGGPADWEAEFERLFTDAVGLRLRADVEVGSCLSGGVDSSAVVTTAARLQPRPIHAFTCAYDEGPAYDERPYARLTIEASGATPHLVVPDGTDFFETFDRLHDQQGEPTAGPGLYSQWMVMELAHRSGLKVLLDGQGADETLAGYFRYLPLRLRDLLGSGDLAGFARLFGPVSRQLGAAVTLALALEPWLPGVAPLRRSFGQGKDRVLSKALRALGPAPAPIPRAEWGSALADQLAFDTRERLLPSLLRYEDRNSMAFSIETRLPFLDYRLVELAFSLPDEQKVLGLTRKAILKRALADRIPPPIRERADKMGFETPTDRWLRERFASETRKRLLTPGPLHEWLEPRVLEAELEDFLAGRREIGLQVWRWLSLEAWTRRFIATDARVLHHPAADGARYGAHRSYVEVVEALEREAASA